jgi:hypothetical protein
VRGVRATREAQVDLLRHEHARDAAERAQLASELRRAVDDDFGYRARLSGAHAAREDAKRYVERYFATTLDDRTSPAERSAALEAALVALEPVALASNADADHERARAARLDQIGTVIAVSTMILTVAVLVLVGF